MVILTSVTGDKNTKSSMKNETEKRKREIIKKKCKSQHVTKPINPKKIWLVNYFRTWEKLEKFRSAYVITYSKKIYRKIFSITKKEY